MERDTEFTEFESITACAARTGVSAGILYRMIRDGRLVPYMFADTSIRRLKVAEVDALFVPQAA
ncbi:MULTISPECIES: hypothetical protein [unclassified Rhodococcus (in: high G+C Gram-positive bacteria)]|uniref:hypothetical protein n=1 Tax=unclassified Rhodococcus (in: high G+C Gram-positive bacteria) TaxID=192944 RepID=UPI0011406B7A|nr:MULTISPECIES: hypothetical protein [unclassified Rhodococcus (in: high G+C Gram-positive bacteria)]